MYLYGKKVQHYRYDYMRTCRLIKKHRRFTSDIDGI